MESIKNKMESLVKDKDEHTEVFMNLEGDTTKLKTVGF